MLCKEEKGCVPHGKSSKKIKLSTALFPLSKPKGACHIQDISLTNTKELIVLLSFSPLGQNSNSDILFILAQDNHVYKP